MLRLARLTALAIGALAIAAVLSVGALYGWLRHDPRNVEVSLEWLLSELLDRQLDIGELTEAELGERSRIVARDVSLANADWAEASHFVSAAHLVLELDIPSLWHDGPVLIHHVELGDATLNLQQAGDRPGNWDFWPERVSTPAPDDSPLPVVIVSGEVRGGVVHYLDDNQDIRAHLENLDLADSGDDMLALDVTGDINGVALSAHGGAGPARALFTGRKLQLDLALAWGDLTLNLLGSGQRSHRRAAPCSTCWARPACVTAPCSWTV